MRTFKGLSEQEILALAISLEEEDARIYEDFAEGLKDRHPALAAQYREMRVEEDGHRHRLLDLYRQKFGDHIPLIRRHDVKGFVHRGAVWRSGPLEPEDVRRQAQMMEAETKQFYESAARQTVNVSIRQPPGRPGGGRASRHVDITDALGAPGQDGEEAEKRLFLLQVVQPGLAGLMDGSVF